MSKVFAVLFLGLITVTEALACPYCAGNNQNGKDDNTTLILGIFILSIYVPYYVIYRLIKKHRIYRESLAGAHDSPGSPNP